MPELLEIHDIQLQRGDFSLRVEQMSLTAGQLYVLTGVNGAGKSTLLQLLALLQLPTQGEIVFAGNPVPNHPASLKRLRRQITLVEQNPFLFSGTVAQNLAFGLKLRRIYGSEQQQRIEEALQTTGLQGFAQRQVKELSGGEARRVAVARALALKPRLLLLDEPTANLDRDQVALLENFLIGLPAQGMTVVIASHDAQQPKRLVGEVISLENGRLSEDGTRGHFGLSG